MRYTCEIFDERISGDHFLEELEGFLHSPFCAQKLGIREVRDIIECVRSNIHNHIPFFTVPIPRSKTMIVDTIQEDEYVIVDSLSSERRPTNIVMEDGVFLEDTPQDDDNVKNLD